MKWQTKDQDHYAVSDCLKYRVSVSQVKENKVYTAWYRNNGWEPIFYNQDKGMVVQACKDHRDGVRPTMNQELDKMKGILK